MKMASFVWKERLYNAHAYSEENQTSIFYTLFLRKSAFGKFTRLVREKDGLILVKNVKQWLLRLFFKNYKRSI